MAVGAAVDNVDATMGSVAENDDARFAEVHRHDGAAHRQGLQRRRLLGDDGRGVVRSDFGLIVAGGKHVALRRDWLLAPGEVMLLELALVAAETFLDTI